MNKEDIIAATKARFDRFNVDLGAGKLQRSGLNVPIQAQPFQVLRLLLIANGEAVSRDQLRAALWPEDTFVDFEHSLNTAVRKLRQALEDTVENPKFIETIPRLGYRFIAAVEWQPAQDPNQRLTSEESRAAPAPAPNPRGIRPFTIIASVVASILLASVGGLIFHRARANQFAMARAGPNSSAFQIIPITSASGNAIFPTFSPDGREIAFIWDGPDRRRYDVYVQLVGADQPLRLTYSKSGQIGAPAWSPDGREIAFGRCDGENDGVYVVPALGGAERKLTTAACLYSLAGPLAWLGNGKEMLMIDHCTPDGDFGVVLFALGTGEKSCLTKPDTLKGTDSGIDFVLSPDGGTIAFTRVAASGCCNIYTIPASGGIPRLLTADSRTECSSINDLGCGGLMWTPDGKSIAFVSSRSNLPSLWHVSASDGSVERETTYPAIGNFSRDGRRLVYSERSSGEPPAIWRTDLASMGGSVVGTRKLISSQYPEMDAQPAPDGSRIAWMSKRTGSEEIWTSSANGENPLQFSHLERYSGTPRWSADGRWVAFDSYGSAPSQIFVVDSEGRNLHSIGNGPSFSVVPSWSRNGKWIYFSSGRTGTLQVWKHSLETGDEVQLTKNGGFDASESLDGQTVYFSKFDRAGIWSMPVKGGSESVVVAKRPQIGFWGYWAVTEAGIYFLDFEAEPRPSIDFYSFVTRRISPVLALEKKPARLQASLSTTADGKTLYYTQNDREGVIKMMEISH